MGVFFAAQTKTCSLPRLKLVIKPVNTFTVIEIHVLLFTVIQSDVNYLCKFLTIKS